ncbi:DUF2252 domain-containing protein [Hoyosella sp. YIM 151337]|uniref:DUF2252 domain-containing protein n=1 Tax=Hoyosella sp. YIM 151337 TaxID=2992742 RepID=UPI0022367928|nr:DUF2252 domain-containing protein [Hoyosella sp. YIM 151337]MCW4355447.1 DUF2252 domain-containing protein [Hoyosella sp. YIM 151337]
MSSVLSNGEVRVRATNRVDADAEAGKSARKRAPRKSSGNWDPSRRTAPALDRLRAQEAVRDHSLLPIRYARMASSSWAYLRGAAAVMAADLATSEHSGLTVQMCGDAHILNFGLWASPERRLLFDARDFDETLEGPFEWDLKRLATSIFVLADTEGVSTSVAAESARAAMRTYRDSMRRYAKSGELEVWYDSITAQETLRRLSTADAEWHESNILKRSEKRSQAGATRQLTEVVDGRRKITEAPPKRRHFTLGESEEISVYNQVFDTYLDSITPYLRRLVGRFTRVDSVQQVVGVGSVGMRVYLHLMEGDSGREPVMFQVKQAAASVYEEFLGPSPFGNHGQRVTVGQRLMQSASDIFLGYVRVDGLDYYVRQFRDMKVIPSGREIAGILPEFSAICGRALAKSHARSGDPAAIAGYLGKGDAFVDSMISFGTAYAAQTVADHAELVDAIGAGVVPTTDTPW